MYAKRKRDNMENMTNVIDNIQQDIHNSINAAIEKAARDICENMRDKLKSGGHAGTGKLLDSITYDINDVGGGYTEAVVSMASYGKFIDSGTGKAHGGVREGYWRYKDREGNWHTTDGMDADPFIDISVDTALNNLGDEIAQQLNITFRG